jgi:hypothetical protein
MKPFRTRKLSVVLALLLAAATAALVWRQGGAPASVDDDKVVDPPALASTAADAPPQTTADPPPPPRGFRVAPEVRQQYADRVLFADSDLAPYAEELRRLAEAGDADAAATLAELYRACAGDLGALTPSTVRCGSLGQPGQDERRRLQALATEWLQRAARLGHGPSVLATHGQFLPNPYLPPGPEELALRRVIVDMLREGDHGALLTHPVPLSNLGAEYTSDAWELAFCAMLAPCIPGPQRYCVHANRCDPVRGGAISRLSRLPQRQQRIVSGQQAEILEILRSGDYERLWRNPRTLPGRG